MIDGHDAEIVIAGTLLIATGTRDAYNLTEGKIYKALYDADISEQCENGFQFPPYIPVIGDNNEKNTCHLSRFDFAPLPEKTRDIEDGGIYRIC